MSQDALSLFVSYTSLLSAVPFRHDHDALLLRRPGGLNELTPVCLHPENDGHLE